VQLDVLPVGQVGAVAAEQDGDLADDAQLGCAQLAAVDAHSEHEVLVFELMGFERGGLAAVDARLALRVEAPPAHPTVQVGVLDGVEALLGIDLFDPLPHVQSAVLLLPGFVAVQGRGAVHLPLPVRT
jgi:hypothetical protein